MTDTTEQVDPPVVAPQANPPTTIGPFNNVPAPGSPIRSDWCQSVSTYITNNVLRKDTTGAQTVTSNVTFNGAVVASSLTASSGNVFASSGNVIASGVVQAQSAGTSTFGGPVTATGSIVSGSSPTDVAIGSMLRNDGAILSTLNDPAVLGTPNLALQRTGVSGGVGGVYVSFRRLAGSTQIGSITIVTGPGVAYNTTSDRRLKDVVGPVADALTRLRSLIPRRLRWKAEPEAGDFDGFIADEVQDVVPSAVTGDRDAVTDDGDIDPQQLDQSRLVPLLVAAVQELAGRVDQLESR